VSEATSVLCLLLANAAVTTAVDIYSFGICALEVCWFDYFFSLQ